ncbi:MAG TPA: PH domain-containing protein [Verrucomicrobiae bacterium]|nr:PH domain-containing protein [Verrucomicrobiae bacterium]
MPETAKAEVYPPCCTVAILAVDRTNLERLKDLPVPEIVQFGGLKYVNDAGKSVNITTWRDFVRYRQAGYRDADNSVNVMSGWFWRTRGQIPFLGKAIPARQSFVRDLHPGKDFVRLLPLDIAPMLGEESNDAGNAIKQHKSWMDFYPQTRITEKTGTDMSLQMGRYEMSLTILAYGDFNHDGFDDMLVWYQQRVTDGTFYYSGLAVLTRTNATDCLHTLPADF